MGFVDGLSNRDTDRSYTSAGSVPKDERVGLSRGGMLEIVCLRVFTRRKFCNVGDTPFDRLRTSGAGFVDGLSRGGA